jgi:hypothetical protein
LGLSQILLHQDSTRHYGAFFWQLAGVDAQVLLSNPAILPQWAILVMCESWLANAVLTCEA